MRRSLVIGLAIGTVAVAMAGIVAEAFAQARPLDMIRYRQSAMKGNGGYLNALNAYAKGEVTVVTKDTIKAYAAALVGTSLEIPGMFPAGTDTGRTNAKPEIWQKNADFLAAAKRLGEESTKLAEVATAGNEAAMKEQIGKVAQACGGCHQPFRKPLPPAAK